MTDEKKITDDPLYKFLEEGIVKLVEEGLAKFRPIQEKNEQRKLTEEELAEFVKTKMMYVKTITACEAADNAWNTPRYDGYARKQYMGYVPGRPDDYLCAMLAFFGPMPEGHEESGMTLRPAPRDGLIETSIPRQVAKLRGSLRTGFELIEAVNYQMTSGYALVSHVKVIFEDGPASPALSLGFPLALVAGVTLNFPKGNRFDWEDEEELKDFQTDFLNFLIPKETKPPIVEIAFVDDDGEEIGKRLRVKVRVEVSSLILTERATLGDDLPRGTFVPHVGIFLRGVLIYTTDSKKYLGIDRRIGGEIVLILNPGPLLTLE